MILYISSYKGGRGRRLYLFLRRGVWITVVPWNRDESKRAIVLRGPSLSVCPHLHSSVESVTKSKGVKVLTESEFLQMASEAKPSAENASKKAQNPEDATQPTPTPALKPKKSKKEKENEENEKQEGTPPKKAAKTETTAVATATRTETLGDLIPERTTKVVETMGGEHLKAALRKQTHVEMPAKGAFKDDLPWPALYDPATHLPKPQPFPAHLQFVSCRGAIRCGHWTMVLCEG